jgi:hypothetical protein
MPSGQPRRKKTKQKREKGNAEKKLELESFL